MNQDDLAVLIDFNLSPSRSPLDYALELEAFLARHPRPLPLSARDLHDLDREHEIETLRRDAAIWRFLYLKTLAMIATQSLVVQEAERVTFDS